MLGRLRERQHTRFLLNLCKHCAIGGGHGTLSSLDLLRDLILDFGSDLSSDF